MLLLKGHTDSVYCVAYSPDGQYLASGGADHHIHLWDRRAPGQPSSVLAGHTDGVWKLAFASCPTPEENGEEQVLLSGGQDGTVRMWKVATGKCVGVRDDLDQQVRTLAVAPAGDRFATGRWNFQGRDPFRDKVAAVWSLPAGQFLGRIETDPIPAECRDLPPGEAWLNTQPQLRSSVRSGLAFPPRVWGLAFSPDGNTLAVGIQRYAWLPSSVILYDLTRNGIRAILAQNGTARDLAFASTEHTQPCLAVTDDERTMLWDLGTYRVRETLVGHEDWIWNLAFTPDGQRLLTASRDETVRMWNAQDGRQLHAWNWDIGPLWSLAIAPDGQTAAVGGQGGSVLVWDLDI